MLKQLLIVTCTFITTVVSGVELPALTALRQQLPVTAQSSSTLIVATGDNISVNLNDGATSELIPLTDSDPSPFARRVRVVTASNPVWRVVAHSSNSTLPVANGENVAVSVWLRAPEAAGGSSATVSIYASLNAAPWTGVASSSATLDQTWKEVLLAGTAPEDFPTGSLNISIHLGSQAQVVDIAAVIVFKIPNSVPLTTLPTTQLRWDGMEENAAWRASAAERIIKLRQTPLTVQVNDAAGGALAGASVRLQQVGKQFPLGSYFEPPLAVEKSPNGDRYRSEFLSLFNQATVPLFWADWGWPKERENYDAIISWASSRKLVMRADLLIYPGWKFLPSAMKALSDRPVEFQQAMLDHIAEMGREYGQVPFEVIEVTNELRDLQDEAVAIVGREGVAGWFAAARKAFPGKKLLLNENTILTNGGNTQANQDLYLDWYNFLKSNGVAPDVLGFQGHFSEALTGPEKIWSILDRFAKETDAELHITEFDINTLNEKAQGAYTRDALTACFAHHRVTSITLWGFYEACMWQRNAALYRSDWTKKPSGDALVKLLNTWQTSMTLTTNADGAVTAPVFLGDIQVTATLGDRTVTKEVHCTAPSDPMRLMLAFPSK